MDHAEVINRVKGLVPEIQRSHDPRGELLKLAHAENLSPAQLERVAQMFNAAKTLNFLDKSANRGGSFALVDTEELLDAYTDHKIRTTPAKAAAVKQASAEVDPDDINAWLDTPVQEKSASRFPRAEWLSDEPFEKLASAENPFTPRPKKANTRLVLDLIEEVRDQFNTQALDAISHLKQAALEGQWTDLEEDAIGLLGEDIRPALDEAYAHITVHGTKVARFQGKSLRKLARDRTGYMPQISQLADAMNVIAQSHTLAELEKEAAKPERKREKDDGGAATMEDDDTFFGPSVGTGSPKGVPNKPRPKQSPDFQSSVNPRKPLELAEHVAPKGEPSGGGGHSVMDGLLAGMRPVVESVKKGPQMKMPWEAGLGMRTSDILNPGSNRKQMKIDEALADDDSLMMLQRFMMSDPVLSEADPDMVVQLYNAVRSINPEFSTDPHRMRLALRDLVQYEALPMQTIKDLTTLRADTANADSAVARTRSDQYRTAGGKSKDKDK